MKIEKFVPDIFLPDLDFDLEMCVNSLHRAELLINNLRDLFLNWFKFFIFFFFFRIVVVVCDDHIQTSFLCSGEIFIELLSLDVSRSREPTVSITAGISTTATKWGSSLLDQGHSLILIMSGQSLAVIVVLEAILKRILNAHHLNQNYIHKILN